MTHYNYENQAWVENKKYIRCGHPETMDCKCYGKIHEGEIEEEFWQPSNEIDEPSDNQNWTDRPEYGEDGLPSE